MSAHAPFYVLHLLVHVPVSEFNMRLIVTSSFLVKIVHIIWETIWYASINFHGILQSIF